MEARSRCSLNRSKRLVGLRCPKFYKVESGPSRSALASLSLHGPSPALAINTVKSLVQAHLDRGNLELLFLGDDGVDNVNTYPCT